MLYRYLNEDTRIHPSAYAVCGLPFIADSELQLLGREVTEPLLEALAEGSQQRSGAPEPPRRSHSAASGLLLRKLN